MVTFHPAATVRRPLLVAGHPILEPGSPVIWFTFPRRWFDVGRFHLANGRFTGWYANVLTPVEINPLPTGEGPATIRWDTTDLFLDVWRGADGTVALLDDDEFEAAVTNRWLDPATAETARATADHLLADAHAGLWPPPITREWTLARVRASQPSPAGGSLEIE